MAIAGKKGKLYASGTTTAFTAEPCTRIGTTNSFQINTSAKRVLDPAAALTVKIGGVAQLASALVTINPYFGIFNFLALPGGAVTIDGSYLPLIQVANVRDWSLAASATVLDTTPMGQDYRTKAFGLKDAKGDFSGMDPLVTVIDAAAGVGHKSLYDWWNSEDPKLLEMDADGANTEVFRVWTVLQQLSETSAIDALVNRKVTWEGALRELSGLAVKVSPAMLGAP